MHSHNNVSPLTRKLTAVILLLITVVVAGRWLGQTKTSWQTGAFKPVVINPKGLAFMPLFDDSDSYPGPPFPPTSTPVPPGVWYPIPPGIPYEVVTLTSAPDADILTVLQGELDSHNVAALAVRAVDMVPFIVYQEERCRDAVYSYLDLQNALAGLFAAGSIAKIQGYFRQADTAGNRDLAIIVSGWQGTVPFPNHTPDPNLPWCDHWPTSPSLWSMMKIGNDPAWRWEDWWPGEYDSLVRYYADLLESTYYVIRP